jgi:DNA-binding transcriptional LysR family regulator
MSAFMHVHLIALRYFGETVRHGSMRQAAESLHVAASAINRQILKLEDQLECKLFERHPEGVRLTAAGEVLYRYILGLERDLNRAIAEIDDLRGLRRGHVAISCEDGIARDFLPGVLAEFHRNFPRVTYSVDIAAGPNIVGAVIEGATDIGIGLFPPYRSDISIEANIDIPIGVIAALDHPFALRRQIRLSDLVNERVIQPKGGVGAHPEIYSLMRGWMPNGYFIETNTSDSLTNLVKAGLGLAVRSPVGIMREIQTREIAFIPLSDPALKPGILAVYAKPQRALPVAGAVLLERIKKGLAAFTERIAHIIGVSERHLLAAPPREKAIVASTTSL